MTSLAVWQRTIVDDEGSVIPFATVEVRSEGTGALVSLWSDRGGIVSISNPATADGDGFLRLFISGGAYRFDVTGGSFSQTLRYVPIGTAQELDIADLSGQIENSWARSNNTDNAPDSGKFQGDNTNLTSVSVLYLSRYDSSTNDHLERLLSFDDSDSTNKGHLIIRDILTGAECSFSVTGDVVDYTDASPAHDAVEIPVTFLSGSDITNGSECLIRFFATGDKGEIGDTGPTGATGPTGPPGAAGTGGGLSGNRTTVTSDMDVTIAYTNRIVLVESSDSPPTSVTLTFDPAENLEEGWIAVIKNENCPIVNLVADTSSPPNNLINNEGQIELLSGEWAIVSCDGESLSAQIYRQELPSSLTEGDIFYYDGASVVALGAGDDDQVLTLTSGVPVWADRELPSPLTEGDIFYYDGANVVALGAGDDDQVLTLASGVPTWADAAAGSGVTDTDRQNFALSAIYQAKAFGAYRRMIDFFADGYKGSGGVSAGSSSNYSVDTTNGRVAPTVATTTIVDRTSDVALADRTYVDRGTFITNSVTIAKIGAYKPASGTIYVKILKRNSAGNYDTVISESFTHDGSGWQDFTLSTPYAVPSTGDYCLGCYAGAVSFGVGTTNRAYANGNIGIGTGQAFTEDTSQPSTALRYVTSINNMTVVTTAQTTDASVSTARALLEFNPVDSITLNTDLTVELSCNGGSNWASATLSLVTAYSQTGRTVAETDAVACTSGTSFQARIKSLNNKDVQVYGTTIQVS
jgi:hypothetical protein